MKKSAWIWGVASCLVLSQLQASEGLDVYQQNCAACHDVGLMGAPRLGDHQVWRALVAKGVVQLNRHAIEGFAGQKGYMPPKGGNPSLTDEQVKQAVRYMMDQVW